MTLAFREVEISGIERGRALHTHITQRMRGVLQPIKLEPISARAAFFDDNGPKGGRASRCALTVRLPHRRPVRVEHTAETPRLAFDAGFAILERQLERYRERDRESRRHPKKYFAARQALAGEAAPPPKRSRRG
jgi:ribosome-associated translation inhibitor RaiA